MITVTLPAHFLPDGATVRKPTGTKPHILRRKVPLYDQNGKQLVEADFCLVHESGINLIDEDQKVSVDFPNVNEALYFMEDIQDLGFDN